MSQYKDILGLVGSPPNLSTLLFFPKIMSFQ